MRSIGGLGVLLALDPTIIVGEVQSARRSCYDGAVIRPFALVLLLAACGSSSPKVAPPVDEPPAHANGAIVERTACVVPDHAEVVGAPELTADILHSSRNRVLGLELGNLEN